MSDDDTLNLSENSRKYYVKRNVSRPTLRRTKKIPFFLVDHSKTPRTSPFRSKTERFYGKERAKTPVPVSYLKNDSSHVTSFRRRSQTPTPSSSFRSRTRRHSYIRKAIKKRNKRGNSSEKPLMFSSFYLENKKRKLKRPVDSNPRAPFLSTSGRFKGVKKRFLTISFDNKKKRAREPKLEDEIEINPNSPYAIYKKKQKIADRKVPSRYVKKKKRKWRIRRSNTEPDLRKLKKKKRKVVSRPYRYNYSVCGFDKHYTSKKVKFGTSERFGKKKKNDVKKRVGPGSYNIRSIFRKKSNKDHMGIGFGSCSLRFD